MTIFLYIFDYELML